MASELEASGLDRYKFFPFAQTANERRGSAETCQYEGKEVECVRGYYDHDEYEDRNEGMSVSASHCSRFSGRSDVSMFNMTDYQSCENCRHMTADSRCIFGLDRHFLNMR